ncbi:MAG: HAMP domain-containing histidine kinase [Acidobacteriia bacterium]|nr:HAMP domain-containing histidine kinase [Terriglobia bacterium]
MIPAPALLVAAIVLSGTIKEEKRALAAVDQVTTARQRLQEVSALLKAPGAPQQDYRTLTQLSRDLDPVSSDPNRRREIEGAIQEKIESLAALSATNSPEDALLDKNRQATESLQSSVSALTFGYDHLLSSGLSYVKTIRAKEFTVCFQGAFIFLLGEFMAATVFLTAITGQIQTLKANSHRLAQGLSLEPLFADNWELNQIGHHLIQASVVLNQQERDLEKHNDRSPDSSAAERQLANEQNEAMVSILRDRNQEIAGALSSAREALAAKGRFLADLSRELRIPLTSILGFSELLYDGKLGALSEQQKGCLSDILAGSKRMLQLTDSVLGAISSESAPAPAPASAVDIERLAKDVKYLLEPAARRKGVRVEVEIDPGLREVDGDPEKLKPLLHQHISDAIQFTPHDAVLELRLRPEGENALRLEVHIRGLGLLSKDVVRLFPEFHVDLVSVKIRAEQQHVAAAEDHNVFYAILPGVARRAESTVRARDSKARAAAKNSTALIQ